jgi:hypothetical protein
MSLLNRPSDGMHSVLVVIHNLIVQEGSLPFQQIIELCSPEGCGDPAQVRQTLNTWIEFGLFTKSEDQKVSFSKSLSKSEKTRENLRKVARKFLFATDNNPNLWAAEGTGSADFTRSVAWLLAQDVYQAELSNWSDAQSLLQKQTNKSINVIQNDTRWSGLKAWSQFLGFAVSGKFPSGVLIIDPTDAVRDSLPEVFHNRTKMAADDFIAELATIVPVLDSGNFRKDVESKLLEHGGWTPLDENNLSTSLSRAVLRLIHEGVIAGENLSDAGSRLHLMGRANKVIETFSHLRLTAN